MGMRPDRPGGENDPSRAGHSHSHGSEGGKDLQKLMERAEHYKQMGMSDNDAMAAAEKDGSNANK